jgi:hypothetical protein
MVKVQAGSSAILSRLLIKAIKGTPTYVVYKNTCMSKHQQRR